MPQNTSATDDSTAALSPELEALIPSGSEIYDSLMGSIEPELLSKNLPSLTEKYKDESPEEKDARMERYRAAFIAYDKAYEQWIQALRDAVKLKRGEAYRAAEEEQREEEVGLLADLESQFE